MAGAAWKPSVLAEQMRQEHPDLAGSERLHETGAAAQSVWKQIDGTTRHDREGDGPLVEYGRDRDKSAAARADADERTVEQFVPRQFQRLFGPDNQPGDIAAESGQKPIQMVGQQVMVFHDQHAPRTQQDGRLLPVEGHGLLAEEWLDSDEELLRNPSYQIWR
jgi:hypothetical protein